MPSNSPTPDKTAPERGTLYLVTTPIGNLEDITLRALRILGEADWIAAEDTRPTRQLLAAHRIAAARLVSYHEHNEQKKTPELIEKLTNGESIALVTNAGTPAVSDPGYRLVRAAVDNHLRVVPIPGVSAALTALCASGLPTDAFTFLGFPSRRKSKRFEQLRESAKLEHTLIFYQSPRRLLIFLAELLDIMGDRHVVVGRELTKFHEEFVRGRAAQVISVLKARNDIRGECTVLVGPAEKQETQAVEEDLMGLVNAALLHDHRPLSVVAKEIAKVSGRTRKEIYDLALRIRAGRP